MKEAYFAGGCFWCIAPTFRTLQGVKKVVSGYSGGAEINPSYEQVKSGLTNHRETIYICYDEEAISYKELLQIFLWNIDPFDSEGQFIDKGHSYTLAIYYKTSEEYQIAFQMINQLKADSGKQPFISLEQFKSFYPAEEYHQNYDLKNPLLFQRELEESGRTEFFKSK